MRLVGETDIDAMLSAVAGRASRPAGILFLPYLTGERTPHNNPNARGVFFGLDPSTDKVDLIQAILEGVAFSLKDAQDCLEAAGRACLEPAFMGAARGACSGRAS
jgi:xylulokinase